MRRAVALLVVALSGACGDDPAGLLGPRVEPALVDGPTVDDPIGPLPTEHELDTRKVALGERLFRDPILSPDGATSCATCHELGRGGVDGRTVSQLPGHEPMPVNTPTVYNLAYNFRFHWAGSHESLEEQLTTPIESPRALATTFDAVVGRLRRNADYRAAFAALYPEGVTVASFKNALVTYERSLVTPNSRFDQYLGGNREALTKPELEGYELFKDLGCASCHQGINVGGNMFQKLGVMREFFATRGKITDADLGRYSATGREEDRHVFRVPSLRNVAVTGPYLHDGSVTTLEEVIQIMATHQLGRSLAPEQVASLVSFLGTLTGEYRGRRLE